MGGTWGGWGGMGGVVMGGDGGGGGGGGGGWWFDQTPLKKRFAPKTTKISKKEVHQKTLKKCKIDTFFYLQTSVHMVSLYLPPPPMQPTPQAPPSSSARLRHLTQHKWWNAHNSMESSAFRTHRQTQAQTGTPSPQRWHTMLEQESEEGSSIQ
jgi:hypothetical protein